jgi:hypothetical protein
VRRSGCCPAGFPADLDTERRRDHGEPFEPQPRPVRGPRAYRSAPVCHLLRDRRCDLNPAQLPSLGVLGGISTGFPDLAPTVTAVVSGWLCWK